MKKIEIFDPAMCCSTGVCGTNIDSELLRVATVVDSLKKQGADIVRYNMSGQPQAFVDNAQINKLLNMDSDILPVTLVDGEVVKTKAYLTTEEFTKYSGFAAAPQAAPSRGGPCCCGSDSGSGCC